VQAVGHSDRSQFFLRGDLNTSYWTLGCHHSHQLKTHFHSYEVTTDAKQKMVGIYGKAFLVKFAGEY
jgi:hypothetical protein